MPSVDRNQCYFISVLAIMRLQDGPTLLGTMGRSRQPQGFSVGMVRGGCLSPASTSYPARARRRQRETSLGAFAHHTDADLLHHVHRLVVAGAVALIGSAILDPDMALLQAADEA